MFKVGGLFSGVGGIELGFERTGKFKILWSNEIDKYAWETFEKNHNHRLIKKSIYDLKASELEPVDVLTGGFPCQAFSIAGYRKGFKDERGELFFEIMRIIDEFEKIGDEFKPKALLLENVKNFKTHDSGRTISTVESEIRSRGYSFFVEIINTSEVTDIPQNRERTFMVCFKDENESKESREYEKTAGEVFRTLFPPQKINSKRHIQEILEEGKVDNKFYYDDRYKMFDKIKKSVLSEDTTYQWRRKYVRENKSNEFPTLTANMGTGGHNVPIIKEKNGIRKLTPKECFRLQGYPEINLSGLSSNAQLYKQAGNMVTVDVIELIANSIYESLKFKNS